MVEILCGECVEAMKAMPESSVDAIVCDPPYGLEFMGKEWDRLLRTDHESDDATGRGSWAFGGTPSSAKRVDAYRAGKTAQDWHQAWATEALRVLKPGGHLLAFGGTRTYHRLACAIEDAGFEIRDSLVWLYGSGFPKSLDVSKAIDKAAGAEREVVGESQYAARRAKQYEVDSEAFGNAGLGLTGPGSTTLTAPATPEAQKWNGWGTALKPGHEPIVMARKPLSGTVAQNVTEHGTGALNIDGCRIGKAEGDRTEYGRDNELEHNGGVAMGDWEKVTPYEPHTAGRWSPNVALSHLPDCSAARCPICGSKSRAPNHTYEQPDSRAASGFTLTTCPDPWHSLGGDCAHGCPIAELDEQSGEQKSGTAVRRHVGGSEAGMFDFNQSNLTEDAGYGDSGGASRFFYQAKASRGERNAGLDGFEERPKDSTYGDGLNSETKLATAAQQEAGTVDRGGTTNHHPTVKPIDLMRWLVRLVTPPGGTVLDPFTGSGTTGIAAVLEGFDFIGIEREAEYVEIARARLAFWEPHAGRDIEDVLVEAGFSERLEREHREAGQMGLLDG